MYTNVKKKVFHSCRIFHYIFFQFEFVHFFNVLNYAFFIFCVSFNSVHFLFTITYLSYARRIYLFIYFVCLFAFFFQPKRTRRRMEIRLRNIRTKRRLLAELSMEATLCFTPLSQPMPICILCSGGMQSRPTIYTLKINQLK